jgi:hypothetical protein
MVTTLWFADGGGNIVTDVRMDGAWISRIDLARESFHFTAFDISTKDLAGHSQSGGQFSGIHASDDDKIMFLRPSRCLVAINELLVWRVARSESRPWIWPLRRRETRHFKDNEGAFR